MDRAAQQAQFKKEHRRMMAGRAVVAIIRAILILLVCAVVLLPLVWMIITSLKIPTELYTFPVIYIPSVITWDNYANLFQYQNVFRNIGNSLYVALLGPTITVVVATPAAYVLNKLRFRGRKLLLGFFLMTQMLPGSMVAMYVTMAKLGMIDKLITLAIMNGAGGITFAILLLQGFLVGVPNELEEGAMIDGCNRIQSFIRIVFPLLMGGIFTVFIFQFIGAWNDSFTAILYLNTPEKKTLPAIIYGMIGQYDTNWGQVAAATIMALLPSVILFSLMKDVFVEGITAGAVKG